jgi:UDP-glucose 4-epimerase
MQNILVTGGAGYIGSHMVWDLLQNDYHPIIVDNFSNSSRRNIDKIEKLLNVKLETLDADVANLDSLPEMKIDAVLHFAAFKSVPESVEDPLKYYLNNSAGTLKLLAWMKERRIRRLIFSSTAAVYAPDAQLPITEASHTNPSSAYGQSKLMSEKFIEEACKAYGLNAVALRYFNVAGNLPTGEIGDEAPTPTALIPRLITSELGLQNFTFEVFGDDYDTRDGTAIRDFVHVLDLVRAHRLALDYLQENPGFHIFNLGSQNGITIKEVIAAYEKVTGNTLKYKMSPRRPGDIPVSIADASKANSELGWKPEYNLEQMIESAWRWYSSWGK